MRHSLNHDGLVAVLLVLLPLPTVLSLTVPKISLSSFRKEVAMESHNTCSPYAGDVMAWIDAAHVPWDTLDVDWGTTVTNPVIALVPPQARGSNGEENEVSSRPRIALHLIPSPKSLSDSLPPNLTRQMTEKCARTTHGSAKVPEQIVHLHEDVWRSKNSIVKARLLSRVGRINSRVYARKTNCRRIDKPTALEFLNANHLWGAVKAKFNYGLFATECDDSGEQREVLVAVAAFGPRRRVNRKSMPYSSHELIRFCTRVDGQVVGGITKLLRHFIRCHDPDDIVTVVDRDWGTASGWEGLGFESVQVMPSLVMAVGQDGIRRHLVGAGIRPTVENAAGGMSETNDIEGGSRPGLPSSVLAELATIEEEDWGGALQCISKAGFNPVYDAGVERLMLLKANLCDAGKDRSAAELWSLSEPKYAQTYYADYSGTMALLRHAENSEEEKGSVTELGPAEMRDLYLERIGLGKATAAAMLSRDPNVDDLQRLLSAQLLNVPFENMDQHTHASDDDKTPDIPRRHSSPSLDVHQTLEKTVLRRRGGFCFELNFAFAWLLRSLGYRARLALADVGCRQAVPAHIVVLLDGLSKDPLLVDVGFGNPGVCEVVLPVVHNSSVSDPHGDHFRFGPDDGTDRFDTALYRTRVAAPGVEEPMYRFRVDDDLDFDADEFKVGLDYVLTTSEFFTTRRVCVLSTKQGHVTLGSDHVKWVERGETVHREELPNETAWRSALADHFGVHLRPEEEE